MLTLEEYVQGVAREAYWFVEFYTPYLMNIVRNSGYEGPNPARFHPSLADKMIIRQLVHEGVKDMDEEDRQLEESFLVDAVKILFWKYYPQYDASNKK